MVEDFAPNSAPIPERKEVLSDADATDRMIATPRDTLKGAFDHIEFMPDLWPEAKRMALANVMMALITIIHGEMTHA